MIQHSPLPPSFASGNLCIPFPLSPSQNTLDSCSSIGTSDSGTPSHSTEPYSAGKRENIVLLIIGSLGLFKKTILQAMCTYRGAHIKSFSRKKNPLPVYIRVSPASPGYFFLVSRDLPFHKSKLTSSPLPPPVLFRSLCTSRYVAKQSVYVGKKSESAALFSLPLFCL